MCNAKPMDAEPAPASRQCACGDHGAAVGRLVEAAQDMDFPALAFPSAKVLETVGETRLRETVRRHHELLRSSPIAGLFSPDDTDFAELIERVADFVVESCGGPAMYSKFNGSTCMRTRHFPFSIDEAAREIWLGTLYQAMEETAFPEPAREEYWNWLEAFSVRMINRRTMKAQPVRVSYGIAKLRFGSRPEVGLPCGISGMRLCPRS